MPISLTELYQASSRPAPLLKSNRTLAEAKASGWQTAFLCHSHRDEIAVKGLVTLLEEAGWKVYVDWADSSMPTTPSRETAEKIRKKIIENNYFLFLATANSINSRWCPWEIGFADGKKPLDRILVIPTSDNGVTYGAEYIELYRRVDHAQGGGLAAWSPGEYYGTNVRSL